MKCHLGKTIMLLCYEHVSLRKTPEGTDGESLHYVDPEQTLKVLGNSVTLIFLKSLLH